MNGKNVSCLVDTRTTHFFMSLNLVKELDLPMRRMPGFFEYTLDFHDKNLSIAF